MKNTHGGKQELTPVSTRTFYGYTRSADPDSVTLINFNDGSFQGNSEEQETGESNAPA